MNETFCLSQKDLVSEKTWENPKCLLYASFRKMYRIIDPALLYRFYERIA